MEKTIIIQGREVTPKDIEFIREMIQANPSWGRARLSKELAVLWNWRAANGQLKDMACRTFLLKLEKRGYLTLPPRRYSYHKVPRRSSCPHVPHKTARIASPLSRLTPVSIEVVKDGSLAFGAKVCYPTLPTMRYHNAVSCNNATISNRQLTGGILTLWLISPLGVTKELFT